ncbi:MULTISPECIES: SPW repeat protein [unclassified Crossiella]|uniref:SPW repeat domain-containing protein n=1 Tax=unclassified Crossiella TaxID=2620835 RepID=UPI001FFFC3B9|nr:MULTISPECIES: SPW repeat protein [unclassified Crossiella]MCK2244874.1 SPW repeat protein [Crossiella sp. S99.2]MCK2258573.1 SPW repeat protein [Crossiella sp. S99.1]
MEKAWSRWQDWAAVVMGVVVLLSPMVLDSSERSMWTMVLLGALLGVSALWSLAQPGSVASEYVHMGLGALLFLAPWVMGYSTELMAAAWMSWVVGVLAILAGASALPAANAAHGLAGSH